MENENVMPGACADDIAADTLTDTVADNIADGDADGDAGINVNDIERQLEAILFAAGYPMSYDRLSETLGLPPRRIRDIAEHYAAFYNDPKAVRGIMLLVNEKSCQLVTKEEYIDVIRLALGIRRGGNLSNSTVEALAIIAYNQPVTRAYVDAVRGVDSAYAVNSLLEKDLIESKSRLDAPGRPMLYTTTETFLRCFGLRSLSELPEADSLIASDMNGSGSEAGNEPLTP